MEFFRKKALILIIFAVFYLLIINPSINNQQIKAKTTDNKTTHNTNTNTLFTAALSSKNKKEAELYNKDSKNIDKEIRKIATKTSELKNPLPNFDAIFLISKDSTSCARNINEAKKITEKHLLDNNSSSIKAIKNAKSKIYPQYIHLIFSHPLKIFNPLFYNINIDKINILKCNYFLVENMPPGPYQTVDSLKLGNFRAKISKENFNYLIWFLIKINLISLQSFNQEVNILESEIKETDDKIIRKDKAIYKVFNDVPPFEVSEHKVEYTYTLDKKNRTVFYSLIQVNK